MARRIRVEFEGAIYHVLNRGDRQEPIFKEDADRDIFLKTLGEACAKTGWIVHAYCLMTNHFHVVVETPQANLVKGMKWFLGTFTQRFNRRYKLSGHLFAGRYKALIVDPHHKGYFRNVCGYAHLNPLRAGLVSSMAELKDYQWSSFPQYLQSPLLRSPWLGVERLLAEMGIPKDSPAGRKKFAHETYLLHTKSASENWKEILHDFCWGEEEFRQELIEQMKLGGYHAHAERRESEANKAQKIICEELAKIKKSESDLAKLPKWSREKLKIAVRLNGETTMTYKWISQRLKMGSPVYLAKKIRPLKDSQMFKSPGLTPDV